MARIGVGAVVGALGTALLVFMSCAGGEETSSAPGGGGAGGAAADGGVKPDGQGATGGSGGSGGSGAKDGGGGTAATGGDADAGDGGNCLDTELCDGLDNTCDNQIDEGCDCVDGQQQECYSGDVNLVGIGECVKGLQTCDIDGIWGPCVNEVLPTAETCDGLDNDCNGQEDEGLGDISCGMGICKVTIDACSGGATQQCVPKPPNPAGETCDGTDDDCDGSVDEGCTCINGQTQSCYSADPATKGVGICVAGTQTCINGAWGTCSGEVTPASEKCDNKDNDCDGTVDDGNPESGGSCNTGKLGVCAVGALNCENGALVCTQTGQPSAEICDGKDNNCDGAVDDGNPGGGGTCNTGQPGVCSAGTLNCKNANLVCDPNTTPTPETCNGADDNCNNIVDDGTNPCGGACALSGNPGNPCDGADGDQCQEGTWQCGGINNVVCSDNTSTNVETCNSADDDCDGTVDEGNNACGGACTLTQSPGGACDGPDTDDCKEGTWTCSGLNNVVCSDSTGNSIEACNGLDDDCDGSIDEGTNACGGVCTLSNAPGTACDGPDSDMCAEGTWQCDGINAVKCSDTTGNSVETCNGADDDCDGTTDEGTNACGGVCTLTNAPGAPCDGPDSDLCQEGTWQCSGLNNVTCSDTTGNTVELCNGMDDDCNGLADYPGGEGNADGDPALKCNDCNDNDNTIYPGAPELCDGKDNDCNPATTAPGGEGNADGDPALKCNDCNDNDPQVYPGHAEVCDGKDNNCNALVDAAEVPVTTLCPSPAHATAQCSGASGCTIQSCATNYYNVNGSYGDGCECLAAPTPVTSGTTCATAINIGTLSDAAKTSVLRSGNVPFSGRDTWYRFNATDDTDTNGDEYHVDIRFTSNPGNIYRMEVYRANCPGSGGVLLASAEANITDWYTDFPRTTSGCTVSSPCGEGNCSGSNVPNVNICNNDSANYFVRIFSVGAPTCNQYTVEMSNGKY